MDKIGICTVYTGYNFGSSLQAYATQEIVRDMGYSPVLIRLSGSLLPGRDVRLKKLLTILIRTMLNSNGMGNIAKYRNSISKTMPVLSSERFDEFNREKLNTTVISYHKLSKAAHSNEYLAFICGSDQVWNAAVYYVDPFYYLRFAPRGKRVAFAPSFGRKYIPEYNLKLISKYVSEIDNKSVREYSGAELIKKITGDNAEVLLDPTLIISASQWKEKLHLAETKRNYLLAYFLDEPNEKAIKTVNEISQKYNLEIIGLPYNFECLPWNNNVCAAGPADFISLVMNATFVCTDSFHGTAFSLNFNIPFFVFERNYGAADKQSDRIKSILRLTSLTNRYDTKSTEDCFNIQFDIANPSLEKERVKAKKYLEEKLGAIYESESIRHNSGIQCGNIFRAMC